MISNQVNQSEHITMVYVNHACIIITITVNKLEPNKERTIILIKQNTIYVYIHTVCLHKHILYMHI